MHELWEFRVVKNGDKFLAAFLCMYVSLHTLCVDLL